MKTVRLTRVVDLIRNWEFISTALARISEKTNEVFDPELLQKTLNYLATDHDRAWVGITYDDDGTPLAFGVSQECTPMFQTKRWFITRWFYHTPGKFEATVHLMQTFETWARANSVSYYAVTTRRSSGEAIKCFSSARYGFKKAYLIFEKQLS